MLSQLERKAEKEKKKGIRAKVSGDIKLLAEKTATFRIQIIIVSIIKKGSLIKICTARPMKCKKLNNCNLLIPLTGVIAIVVIKSHKIADFALIHL